MSLIQRNMSTDMKGVGAGLIVCGVLLASSATSAHAMSPLPGQRCLKSPMALGTGNLPANSDPKTTVVNAKAYFTEKDGAVGWVYLTLSHQWWFQARDVSKTDVATALRREGLHRLADRISDSRGNLSGSGTFPVPGNDLRPIEKAMARLGARRWICFSSPLPAKYMKSATAITRKH